MNILQKIFLSLLVIFFSSSKIIPQSNFTDTTLSIQKNYEANGLHRFFFGDHWRDYWTTPVKFSYLNLNEFAGGLTPIKIGGGQQTKSLQLQGKDGRIYKFRSVDKFPGRSLPDDLRKSVVESFMQDQITTLNPFSTLVVSSLMNAANILHSKPELFIMPDSELLNEYREEFANMIGTIEEKADDYENKNLNFAGAYKIRDTYKMFDEIEEDNDYKVDAVEYLKARLFDIFIGDRDRHSGQWDWAEYRSDNKRIYKPIPKDRDFAFPLYDGIIPQALTVMITSYVHFDYEMPSMLDMTWEGRHLDRRILGIIDKPAWDSVANYFQSVMTDEVITEAVKKLPEEVYLIGGIDLISKLKSRRDQIKLASDNYYKLAMQYVDIYTSNKNELAEVNRLDENYTQVKIFKRDKQNGQKKNEIVYEKKFDHNFTAEIRLHMLGGDDKVIVKGETNNPVLIVVEGGKGDDEFVDSTANSFTVGKAKFYDSGKDSKFDVTSSVYVNQKKYPEPKDESEKYEPVQEDRYYDFGVLVPFAISSDYGLIMGIGGGFNFYDFKMKPYSFRLEAAGSYAFLTESSKFEVNSFFKQLIEDWNIRFTAKASQLEITRFNGIGNETVRDEELSEDDYYQVEQENYSLAASLDYPINNNFSLSLSGGLESSRTHSDENSFLTDSSYYGIGKFSFFNIGGGLTFDSRDKIGLPFNGYFFNLSANYFPALLNNDESFTKLKIDFRSYYEFNYLTNYTLGLRIFSEYVFGKYPFYKGASLGGSNTLRGFPTNRFVADGSFAAQTELRIFLGKPKIIIPGKFGVKLYAETGRVFLENENSDVWHPAWGGGIYYDVLDRAVAINLDVVSSKNLIRYYFTLSYSM